MQSAHVGSKSNFEGPSQGKNLKKPFSGEKIRKAFSRKQFGEVTTRKKSFLILPAHHTDHLMVDI